MTTVSMQIIVRNKSLIEVNFLLVQTFKRDPADLVDPPYVFVYYDMDKKLDPQGGAPIVTHIHHMRFERAVDFNGPRYILAEIETEAHGPLVLLRVRMRQTSSKDLQAVEASLTELIRQMRRLEYGTIDAYPSYLDPDLGREPWKAIEDPVDSEIVRLRLKENLTIKEIADRLGKGRGTVKNRLTALRKELPAGALPTKARPASKKRRK